MRRYLTRIDGGEALIYVFLIIAIAMVITILISSRTTKLRQEKGKFFRRPTPNAQFSRPPQSSHQPLHGSTTNPNCCLRHQLARCLGRQIFVRATGRDSNSSSICLRVSLCALAADSPHADDWRDPIWRNR